MKPKRVRYLGNHLHRINKAGRAQAPSGFWRNYAIAVTVCALGFGYCAHREAQFREERAKVMQDSTSHVPRDSGANAASDGVYRLYRQTTNGGIEVTETERGISFQF